MRKRTDSAFLRLDVFSDGDLGLRVEFYPWWDSLPTWLRGSEQKKTKETKHLNEDRYRVIRSNRDQESTHETGMPQANGYLALCVLRFLRSLLFKIFFALG